MKPCRVPKSLLACWLACLGQSIRTENGGLEAISEDGAQLAEDTSEYLGTAFEERDSAEWFGKKKKKKASSVFQNALVGDLFAHIADGSSASPGESTCGDVLESKVIISSSMHKRQLNETPSEFLRADAEGSTLFARQEAWWREAAVVLGSFPVHEGYRLVAVNDVVKVAFVLNDIKGSWSAAEPDADIKLTFEAGVDLRGCWGTMIDTAGREVCSSELLSGMADELRVVDESQVQGGRRGQRLRVQGLQDFEVTSVDVGEMEAIAKMGPLVAESEERSGANCFWSALAPVCAVLAVPSNHTDSGVTYFMAQRKVTLPAQQNATVTVQRHEVAEMDLRGPKFAVGALKRFFMKDHVWRQQDAGFVKAFPSGISLEGCGSREAALALQLDLEALSEAGIVDYDVSTQFFEHPSEGAECFCSNPDRALPTWPLVLDTAGAEGGRPLRLALAVTDWFTLWEFSRNPFKKKMQPIEYKEALLGGMFPSYFSMEPRGFDVASSTLVESATQAAEKFKVGARVRAMTSMAWSSTCEGCLNPKLLLNHVYNNAFIFQAKAEKRSSRTVMDKGNFQVPAGAWGTLKGIYVRFPLAEGAEPLVNETASLAVEWDMIKPLQDHEPRPVFRVFAEQVMSMPRILKADASTSSEPTGVGGGFSSSKSEGSVLTTSLGPDSGAHSLGLGGSTILLVLAAVASALE